MARHHALQPAARRLRVVGGRILVETDDPIGRYTSQRRPFDATDGEIVNFRGYGGRIWPIYLASIVKPDLALTLKYQ
jgi:hypothetical protein